MKEQKVRNKQQRTTTNTKQNHPISNNKKNTANTFTETRRNKQKRAGHVKTKIEQDNAKSEIVNDEFLGI